MASCSVTRGKVPQPLRNRGLGISRGRGQCRLWQIDESPREVEKRNPRICGIFCKKEIFFKIRFLRAQTELGAKIADLSVSELDYFVSNFIFKITIFEGKSIYKIV